MDTQNTLDRLLSLFKSLHMVDLTQTLEEGMPVYPTHPQYFHLKWRTGDPASMYQLLVSEHAGTHLDSPVHFYHDEGDERAVPVDRLPVESFIGRAVKLDFRGVTPTRELGAEEIRGWEREHAPLQENDAVVFQFGWDRKWARLPEGQAYLDAWPGISREAAGYLVERGVRMACTDCLGIDGSATPDLGSHFALLEHGMLIVENLRNLELVPDVFLLLTLPLKIKEGTGSPVRAVALFA